ncbi:MAG: integrase [Bacteroides sp. 43_108]|nr:MAG: integrase [Bacteroides sp. 43_108]
MATINVKIHPIIPDGNVGTLFYQVVHEGTTKVIETDYKLYLHEWNSETEKLNVHDADAERFAYLAALGKRVECDMRRLRGIIMSLDLRIMPYATDDVVVNFADYCSRRSFGLFMKEQIGRLESMKRMRTSETYTAAYRSFMRFMDNKDVAIDEFDEKLMGEYENFLKMTGTGLNTVSFYMRIMRAVYNRAVDEGITDQRYPFKKVYTGIARTVKRALRFDDIRRIKNVDLSNEPNLAFARDMFMFSFYTRGMSFVDMSFLSKSNLSGGVLSYCRRKTGQRLDIKWEKCMQEIVERYDACGPYILPIVSPDKGDERLQYRQCQCRINAYLKRLGRMMGFLHPLTMYVARHSWASVAKSRNVPLSIISEGMGHDSDATTRIYLASIEASRIDEANSSILNAL